MTHREPFTKRNYSLTLNPLIKIEVQRQTLKHLEKTNLLNFDFLDKKKNFKLRSLSRAFY